MKGRWNLASERMAMDWLERDGHLKAVTRRYRRSKDFAAILMLAAIAGAASQVVGAILDIGRSAGWWH
jgi:hypothetical protein